MKTERIPPTRIAFRAEFQGLLGKLNPLGLKVTTPFTIEIRMHSGSKWCACVPGQYKNVWERIPWQPTAESAKRQIVQYFEKQLTEWEAFEVDASGKYHRLKGVTWFPHPKHANMFLKQVHEQAKTQAETNPT